MGLSDKIKARREELGLTLQEIGDYIGVSKPTVQRYESGEIKNLKLETIEKLSEILKVSPAYLMGWKEEKTNPLQTIAAHFEGEEFTEDDKDDIENFIKYILSKKQK